MKVYETNDIRNVALVGHGHSGKTSLVAGMLFTAGATQRLTKVDEGNTITDFDEEEILGVGFDDENPQMHDKIVPAAGGFSPPGTS